MAPTTATARSHRATTRGGVVAVLAFVVLALAAAPAAAQYPPDAEVAVGTPGATILIEGTDWSPDTQVTIMYRDQDGQTRTTAVTTTAGPDGRFVARVPIPEDAEPGALPLAVTGTGSDGAPKEWTPMARVVPEDTAGAEVAQADPPEDVTAAPALPTTGTFPGPAVFAAVGLLVVGTGALLAARRRSRG